MKFIFNVIILCSCTFLISCGGNNDDRKANEEKSIAGAATDKNIDDRDQSTDHTSDSMMQAMNNEEKKVNRITEDDGDWSAQKVTLQNTREAEWMIRSGDIDNLGFGWDEGFTPFSGKSTFPHGFPWEPDKRDFPGTDIIMVPSAYEPGKAIYGSDGYSGTTTRPDNDPRPVSVDLLPLKNTNIHAALLQLFVDDFQSPVHLTKFQVKVNGLRFIEMEKLLNALQQTGPIGKLINVKLPGDFLPLLKNDSLTIFIDDPVNSAGDGFAVDFVKLLVNPKESVYKGNVEGIIIDKTTRQPITNASAEIRDYGTAVTDKEGKFRLNNIPAGINIITGSATTYASVPVQADVIANETTTGIIIELSPSEKIVFNNKTMREGDDLVLNNIQFELSSANLTDTGKLELDKLNLFMQKNPKVEILLSGHTSKDGTDAFNKELSVSRVRACRSYLISKGIDEGRIQVIGYGAEKPIAPNDTEKNRSKNRRVEMKNTKL
jgi:OOP family OmpA-OmpF porin